MARILIAGGYGLVGSTVARLVRGISPDVELVLAGRQPEKGAALVEELGKARTALLDLDRGAGLDAVGTVDLVVAALYDPANVLLEAALAGEAGYLGITIKAEDVAPIAFAALRSPPRRPVALLGHAGAGAVFIAAWSALRAFARVDSVAVTALYDLADPVGPMTAGDAEMLVSRGMLREHRHWRWVEGSQHPRAVEVDGQTLHGLPTGLLDVPSLASTSGAPNVRFDMAQGKSRGTRRGRGASSDSYIDIEGVLTSGASGRTRTMVSDPRGLIHLTALGVLLAIERVLGLDGKPPAAGGLHLPETLLDLDAAAARLAQFGVEIATESSS